MQRGDVYRLRPPKRLRDAQPAKSYGVVVQADALLGRSVVVVAPTARRAQAASFRPEVQIAGVSTRVLVEMLAAVPAARLGKRVGRLAPEEMWSVDEALAVLLGLS